MERKTQVRILALFCLLFLPALAFSQIIVKGTVKAEDGFGMPPPHGTHHLRERCGESC